MSVPFRPSAVQRRILASLLHLLRTEDSRLRLLGVTVAPTVTVADVFTDLASDKGRSPPTVKAIADELSAVPGVEKIKPNIEITDAVWSMMNVLPPPRVAGEPAPPPPPPPPFYEHPRQPGESGTQLFRRLLNAYPDGLTVRQMRVLSGADLASVASTEKAAGRVRFSQAEPRAPMVYQPLRDPRQPAVEAPPVEAPPVEPTAPPAEYSSEAPQCEATSYVFRCGLPAGHAGSHNATAYDPNTGPEPVLWDDTDPPIPADVWDTKPENADDARPDVAPTLDASPDVGPATAEGGDTSAVDEVALCDATWGVDSAAEIVFGCDLPAGHAGPHHDGEWTADWSPGLADFHPPAPLRVYVATSLDHAHRAQAVQRALRDRGHEITYDWTTHGSVQGEGDARLCEVAAAELQGVRECDVLVAILPGGRGTHTEIGMALGLGLPIVLLEQEGAYTADCAFYHAPNVHRYMWTEQDVLPLLALWAEQHWRESHDPNAPHSIPWQMHMLGAEIADLENALDEILATVTGAGIPRETTDDKGNTICWPTASLVRRLVEREAMHVDARTEAESAVFPAESPSELRTKLATALGLTADDWTWDHLLTEALALRVERDEHRGERHAFAKAVCAAMGKPNRSVDDVGPDFARTLVLDWIAKDVEAHAAANTDRWANFEALRNFVGDVAETLKLTDVDRSENPFRTGPTVLERLRARLRPDQEAEVLETARLLREVEDRLHELVPGYSRPWTCIAAINELAQKANVIDDARQILMDALDSDTSPASLRSFPGEAAIIGVARMAAAQLRHHRLPLAEQLAACRAALADRISALELAADLLGVA